jgi:hypothetical protein
MGFCSVYGLAAVAFFLSFKKMQVLQVCWLTKTMTKKLTATPNPNAFGWGKPPKRRGRLCCGVGFAWLYSFIKYLLMLLGFNRSV